MEVFPEGFSNVAEWSVSEAESLISSLTGVRSVRIVTGGENEIKEIHVLTRGEVSPKQTVRNVESALRAHFDLRLDHRKISVAQSTGESASPSSEDASRPPDRAPPPQPVNERARERKEPPAQEPSMPLFVERHAPTREGRILFLGHRVGSENSHRLKVTVALEWSGKRFTGDASGTALPQSRLEALANATLRALEETLREKTDTDDFGGDLALALQGVKVVEAFDREYVLVSIHALAGRQIQQLSGSTSVRESQDHAVILATLQATDRWVRGRI